MLAAEFVDKIRPLNPGRRFAVCRSKSGEDLAIAIDRLGVDPVAWDMFAAAYFGGQWVQCLIPSILERNEWEELVVGQVEVVG